MEQPGFWDRFGKEIDYRNEPVPPERPQPKDMPASPEGTISGASYIPKPHSPGEQACELKFIGVLNRYIPFEFSFRSPDAANDLAHALRSIRDCSLEKAPLASALMALFQAGLAVTGCRKWNGRVFEPLCVELMVALRREGATICSHAVRAALSYAVDEARWLIPQSQDQSVRFSPHGEEYAKLLMAGVPRPAPCSTPVGPKSGEGYEYCMKVPSLGLEVMAHSEEEYRVKLAELLERLRGREARIEVTRTPRDLEDPEKPALPQGR